MLCAGVFADPPKVAVSSVQRPGSMQNTPSRWDRCPRVQCGLCDDTVLLSPGDNFACQQEQRLVGVIYQNQRVDLIAAILGGSASGTGEHTIVNSALRRTGTYEPANPPASVTSTCPLFMPSSSVRKGDAGILPDRTTGKRSRLPLSIGVSTR